MTTTQRGRRSSAFGATPDGTRWRQSTPLVFLKKATKLGTLASESIFCLAHLGHSFQLETELGWHAVVPTPGERVRVD